MIGNYLINFSCCLKIHVINLLIQFSPVKMLVGKVNLLSMETNFAPIELGMCFSYNVLCLPPLVSILFNKHSVSP